MSARRLCYCGKPFAWRSPQHVCTTSISAMLLGNLAEAVQPIGMYDTLKSRTILNCVKKDRVMTGTEETEWSVIMIGSCESRSDEAAYKYTTESSLS